MKSIYNKYPELIPFTHIVNFLIKDAQVYTGIKFTTSDGFWLECTRFLCYNNENLNNYGIVINNFSKYTKERLAQEIINYSANRCGIIKYNATNHSPSLSHRVNPENIPKLIEELKSPTESCKNDLNQDYINYAMHLFEIGNVETTLTYGEYFRISAHDKFIHIYESIVLECIG
jgi:hypothetical protein